MKKLLFILLILPLFMGCSNSPDPEAEKLKEENVRLMQEAREKDSTINSMFGSFNQIEENLEMIKSKENLITETSKNNPEMNQDVKDRINNDIQLINELMLKNKKSIASLRNKLKKADLKIVEFEKLIQTLNQKLLEKDGEIASLKDQLLKMNFSIERLNKVVDTLTMESEAKTQVIDKQTEELNTAYYVVGNSKELIEHKVISKEGGFVGIGKTKKVAQDFDNSYFTKIDITKVKEITINAKKAKIITTHASDAYNLVNSGKMVDRIVISKPDKFWKASKYLVIVVE